MRKNLKISLMFIAAGLVFTNCAKDEFEEASNSASPNSIQKSSPSNIEKLGMAANIKEIKFIGGNYEVSFYGTTNTYSVTVDSFQPEIGFGLIILDGTTSLRSELDVQAGTLDVQGDKVYSLSALDTYSLSSASHILLRVTSGVIAQHIENPGATINFIDNGTSDTVPDDTTARGCFWCTTVTGTNEFYPGLCVDITNTSMFWGLFNSSGVSDPYAC